MPAEAEALAPAAPGLTESTRQVWKADVTSFASAMSDAFPELPARTVIWSARERGMHALVKLRYMSMRAFQAASLRLLLGLPPPLPLPFPPPLPLPRPPPLLLPLPPVLSLLLSSVLVLLLLAAPLHSGRLAICEIVALETPAALREERKPGGRHAAGAGPELPRDGHSGGKRDWACLSAARSAADMLMVLRYEVREESDCGGEHGGGTWLMGLPEPSVMEPLVGMGGRLGPPPGPPGGREPPPPLTPPPPELLPPELTLAASSAPPLKRCLRSAC